jgi:hypothetical protein
MAAIGTVDVFNSRNVIATAPMAAALAAPALLRLRALPFVAYLALATVTSLWVATDWRYEQADWHHALARVEAIDPGVPVITLTNEPVVRTYLGRQPAFGDLVTQRAWIVVPPIRAAHQRGFGPAPSPSLPGFTPVQRFRLQAFTMTLVSAPHPIPITAGMISGSSLFPAQPLRTVH